MKSIILIFSLICLAVCTLGNTGTTMDKSKIEEKRQPAVSGLFYPSDGEELRELINEHLGASGELPEIDGQIIALIVPHAGLKYSGQIAAFSYKMLENSSVNKVILCGPSHKVRFDGISVYGPEIVWTTPLGDLSCDDNLCRQLIAQDKKIELFAEAHLQEHSLEVQLPYLQTVLNDFTLVPAVMGYPSSSNIDILAEALSAIDFDENTVMIASTDWQHYMSANEGWKYDSLGLECLEELNPIKLQQLIGEKRTKLCGGAPAVAVMKAAIARGADKVKILKYGDSGDITGDKTSVVSYAAAVIYKEYSKNELSDSEKRKLLKIARQSIEIYLKTGKAPKFDVPDILKQPGAAFVTLKKNSQLRGCIGQTVAMMPLYETVSHCAIQAAVSDPRFRPVKYADMAEIHIEISVLTPLRKVDDLGEIEVGRDGLMITMGRNRGLLLPQVATDNGWDRDTFLRQTCHKAGLSADAFMSEDAEIFTFRAIIFGE